MDDVAVEGAQTATIASAGSTSASRQTWMSGGAVEAACSAVRDRLLADVARTEGVDVESLSCRDGRVTSADAAIDIGIDDLTAGRDLTEEVTYRHAVTTPLGLDGQGEPHVAWHFVAHRAVVDVDQEMGLVRVVQLSTGQDVGRALNPAQVLGQIEGGCAQGLGLAVMEEILVTDGVVRNPSFTDYLIPTALDMAPVLATMIEEPEPGAPFGAKGVGEPPCLSSTPAIAAAIRQDTGLELPRVPIRPQDVAFGER